MAIGCPGASLFGNKSQFIKVNGGDLVAIEGVNTVEKMMLSDLRIPYKQLLRSRIILKAGQTNYLLNHLGLGDNVTFLCVKASYNASSLELDNYVNWSYYDGLTRINNFAQLMVLTGNSTHRIPQLYLTNPSIKYAVTLDVMVAIIDDNYTIFTDTLNQTGTSFTGLEYTDIHSYVVGESIVINDKSSPVRPLIYITLNNIASIQVDGNIIILDDTSVGTIFLQFLTANDTNQANSLLNYVISNPSINIDTLNPVADLVSPVIYFNQTAGVGGDWISFNGATGSSFSTTDGATFSTSISLSSFGTASGAYIDKPQLTYLLVNNVYDNRDEYLYLQSSDLLLVGTAGSASNISSPGTYSVTFNINDIAQNSTNCVMYLDITA